MRFIVCLLLGLMIGAIAATTAASILRQRHAYPRALMVVMQHELNTARDAAGSQRCANNEHALRKLALLADDIETAIPHGNPPDRVFRQYLDDLRKQVGNANSVAADCTKQAQALTDIKNACDACHRDFR
jgi:small-conductance mechanosensitive channel